MENYRKKIYESSLGNSNRALGALTRRLASVQFKKSEQRLGIIESTFVADSTLYAIIRQAPPKKAPGSGHEIYPLFNNYLYTDEKKLSALEAFIPITNIDLSLVIINPKDLIGRYAMVTVIGDNRAIKAEYTGTVKDPSQGPLKLVQNALYNARAQAGVNFSLLDEQSAAKPYLEKLIGLNETNKGLLELNVEDVKGKSVRIANDATHSNSTSKTEEGEIVVEDNSDLLANKNGLEMKSRDCHLPILVFTGR